MDFVGSLIAHKKTTSFTWSYWGKALLVAALDGFRAGFVGLYKSGLVNDRIKEILDHLSGKFGEKALLVAQIALKTMQTFLGAGVNGLFSAGRDEVTK